MSSRVVDYLIARNRLPARSGRAYDYVLGGDGLYLCAANDWLEVRAPVARCAVRGLPPVYAACSLRHGRLPVWIWDRIVGWFRAAHVAGTEVLAVVRHDGRAYQLVVPRQVVAPLGVQYVPQDDLVLEVHSHRDGSARFSAIDTADEQGLRLYGVVGRLDRAIPEVALRAGAYGHFLPVPWSSVFDGAPATVEDVVSTDLDPVPVDDELTCGWRDPRP